MKRIPTTSTGPTCRYIYIFGYAFLQFIHVPKANKKIGSLELVQHHTEMVDSTKVNIFIRQLMLIVFNVKEYYYNYANHAQLRLNLSTVSNQINFIIFSEKILLQYLFVFSFIWYNRYNGCWLVLQCLVFHNANQLIEC